MMEDGRPPLVAMLALIVLTLTVREVRSDCEFPRHLQSRDGDIRRDWHGHEMRGVRDSPRQYSVLASFHGKVLQTAVLGGSLAKEKPKPYTRHCLKEMEPNRFLLRHQDHGDPSERYVCMEFLNRSADVIQIKESRLSPMREKTLCDDVELILDDWPMINHANMYQSYTECPLNGGFGITLFDKSRKIGVCDAYRGNVRMESECMSGEGMYFNFRNKNCVPKGLHMHKLQRVYCMGTWEEGPYTFSVIRHDSTEHMWCMRIPKKRGDTFIAFLFHDLVCERRKNPPDVDYIRMDIVRDPPIGTLCRDDYEACEFWEEPCSQHGSFKQLTCARTCGVCHGSRPFSCTIPPQFRGHWLESLGDRKNQVKIDDMSLLVEGFANPRCIQWENMDYSPDTREIEQMLVSTFDNGCTPRYMCAHFKKQAPSILRYKLSQSQMWPFGAVDPTYIDCSIFKYHDDIVPHGSLYHSKHHKTLIAEAERIYVDCQFHGPRKFEVVFEDGVLCRGTLTQEGLSTKNKIKMSLSSCANHQSEQEFACLDSTHHGYVGDQLIVTETLDTYNRIRCFLFPTHPAYTFYLLSTAHCHDGAGQEISRNALSPLARFTETKPITSSDVIVQIVRKEDSDGNNQVIVQQGEAQQYGGEHAGDHAGPQYVPSEGSQTGGELRAGQVQQGTTGASSKGAASDNQPRGYMLLFTVLVSFISCTFVH